MAHRLWRVGRAATTLVLAAWLASLIGTVGLAAPVGATSAPTVTTVSPDTGPATGGTAVTITGTGFSGAVAVSFGTTLAQSITVVSASEITATSPPGTGTVDVTVTTPAGTSPTSSADQFGYVTAIPPPTVISLSPDSGPLAGGTVVTVTGAGFGATAGTTFTPAVTAVQVGSTSLSVPSSAVDVLSPTTLLLATPAAGSAGAVDVTVTTSEGTSATPAADRFTYTPPGPASCQSPVSATTNLCLVANGGVLTTIGPLGLGGALSSSLALSALGTLDLTSGAVSLPAVQSSTSPASVAGVTADLTVGFPAGLTGTYDQGTGAVSLSGPLSVGAYEPELGGFCVFGAPATATGTLSVPQATAVPDVVSASGTLTVGPLLPSTTVPQGNDCTPLVLTVGGIGLALPVTLSDYQTTPPPTPVPPVVTAVSPVEGPAVGGTTVTVAGSGLGGASAVDFGTTAAASFTVDSDSEITAVSPPGTGAVDVTVTTPVGTSATSSADQFTYHPVVTGVTPDAGPEAGGTTVAIAGSGFVGATAVDFGTTPAASFTVDSADEITAVSPAGTAGAVDVTVTTPVGTSARSSADQFSYIPVPAVTGLSPASGPLPGDTTVTITGSGLAGATAVDFGVTPAASFTVVSDGEITAVSPPGTGTVDVTVITPAGTSATSSGDQFTYLTTVALVVTGVSPDQGPSAGGTAVTITGSGFTGAIGVFFGAQPALSFTVVSDNDITATSPAGTGVVDVTVITPSATSATSSADQFTYGPLGPPGVSVTPQSGPTSGGTVVTITGTDLTGATAVDFGLTPAASFTVVSATEVTAVSPPGTGPVDVTVTTPAGTSATSVTDQFTYLFPSPATPAVTGVAPDQGPSTGGTTVTVTGSAFSAATAVDFGTTAAPSFTVVSATEITAVSPPGTGTVDVTVTTPAGTSATSVADQFTYLSLTTPTVTGVGPAAGPAAGGTVVTVTGTKFGVVESIGPCGASLTACPQSSTSRAIVVRFVPEVTAVRFGSVVVPSSSVDVLSPTELQVTSPAATAPGPVDVTVTTPAGTSATSPADRFTYGRVPAVTGVFPWAGPTDGYSLVFVFGRGFSHVTGVTYGGRSALWLTLSSTLLLTLAQPAAAAGTVDVQVTTASGGTSAPVPADHFTYLGPAAR